MPSQQQLAERATKVAFWQPVISDWIDSGKSGAQYCRDNNLVAHNFRYWQQQLAPETMHPSKKSGENKIGFVEVTGIKGHAAHQNATCIINASFGVSITLQGAIERKNLATILTAIKDVS